MHRSLPSLLILICLASACFADDYAVSKDFFDPGKLHQIHIRITAEQWKAMQPPPPVRPDQRGPGPRGPEPRDDPPFARATVEIDGRALNNVAVRFKGNSSLRFAGGGLNKPLKMDFNRFVEDQDFLGLTALNLSNNANDTSALRETLAYELFAAAGVKASRTTYARVYYSIEGQPARQYAGLFTVVEDVGKRFLKDRFGQSKGLLVKPERCAGLPYFGDRWEAYQDRYVAKTESSEAERNRLIALLKLAREGDDAAFAAQVEQFLDIDEFLGFVAVNALTSNMDSLLCTGHNFYLYVESGKGKVRFIPWDLNEAFGGFFPAGSSQSQMNLSLMQPHAGLNRLIERVLAIPAYRERYLKLVKRLSDGPFSEQQLYQRIDALTALIKPAREERQQVAPEPFRGPGGGRGRPELKDFIAGRLPSIAAQLAGTSKGEVLPQMMGGRPRPGGPEPRPRPPAG